MAPGFDADALEVLAAKKNLRILDGRRRRAAGARRCAPIDGGYLVQTPDAVTVDRSAWQVVTKAAPDRGAVGRPRAGLAGRAPR